MTATTIAAAVATAAVAARRDEGKGRKGPPRGVPRGRPFDRTSEHAVLYATIAATAKTIVLRTYTRLPGKRRTDSVSARSYFARTHGIAKRRSARSAGRSRERPSSPRRMQRERCAAPRARSERSARRGRGAGGAGRRSRCSHARLAVPPVLSHHLYPSRPLLKLPRDESEKRTFSRHHNTGFET